MAIRPERRLRATTRYNRPPNEVANLTTALANNFTTAPTPRLVLDIRTNSLGALRPASTALHSCNVRRIRGAPAPIATWARATRKADDAGGGIHALRRAPFDLRWPDARLRFAQR